MPFSATYSVANDTYLLAYNPLLMYGMVEGDGVFSDERVLPDGDWTAFASVFMAEGAGGIGIIMQTDSGPIEFLVHPNPPVDLPGVFFVPFNDEQVILRVEHFEDGTLVFSQAPNLTEWTEVTRVVPASPVTELGVVLRYDREDLPATGQLAEVQLLAGIWDPTTSEEIWLPEMVLPAGRVDSRTTEPTAGVTSTIEPLVHGIVGAQFGDLEFDVGKSVRWTEWFTDNLFILDVNLGTPRYWIVNWTQTFPYAEHAVTGINYFMAPDRFRREQWEQYCLAFGMPDDSDWFFWCDAHEGLSVDNRSLPNDYSFAPFKSFLWREIQRADDAGQPYAALPLFIFLKSDKTVNVTYGPPPVTDPETGTALAVEQAISTPYYQAHQGLKRLWKASELKKPDFDWSQLDTLSAFDPACKAQIVSYAYARWNLQDIEPPATTVPPLTADNDDGWRMRQLISMVRPVPGLPLGAYPTNRLDPLIGYVTTPDPGPLPAQFTFVVDVVGPTTTSSVVAQHEASTTDRSWVLNRTGPTGGGFTFYAYVAGTATPVVTRASSSTVVSAGGRDLRAVAITVDDGTGHGAITSWTNINGVWSAFATNTTTTGTFATWDSARAVRIGAQSNAGLSQFTGLIYSVELRTGLDPAGGTVIWRFDASEVPPYVTGIDDTLDFDSNADGIADGWMALVTGVIVGGSRTVSTFQRIVASPNASSTMYGIESTAPIPCVAGDVITGRTTVQYTTADAAKVVAQWFVVFYNSAGVQVGTSTVTAIAANASPTNINLTAGTAPANTSYAHIAHWIRGNTGANGTFQATLDVHSVKAFVNGTTYTDPRGRVWTKLTPEAIGPNQAEPAGLPGPWAPADVNHSNALDPVTRLPMYQPVPPDASMQGIVTPLYDNSFRVNMRDGVWYEERLSGNIPLKWDDRTRTWTTDYDPALWVDQGVKSWDPDAVPAP